MKKSAKLTNQDVNDLRLRQRMLAQTEWDLTIHNYEYRAFMNFLLKKYDLDITKQWEIKGDVLVEKGEEDGKGV